MNEEQADPQIVSQYLNTSKALCLNLGRRWNISSRTCPFTEFDENYNDKQKLLQELAEMNKVIAAQLASLRSMEAEHKTFGVARLIGEGIAQNDAVYGAVLLMTLGRMCESLHREIRTVSCLLSLSTQDIDATLILRNAFRSNGILRDYIHIIDEGEVNVDQLRFEISDVSYATVVGLKATKTEIAYGILGRVERHSLQRR